MVNAKKYSIYKHCLVWNGAPNREVKIQADVSKNLIRLSKAWMLRNCYDWDCKEATNYWFIIKNKYAPEDYSKKTRKYIQKANDRFIFKLIGKDMLYEQGYKVYLDAFSKYKVNDGFKESREQFIARINGMNSDFEIWGAIDKETGNLEAYSICKKIDDIVEFESSKANPEFLSKFYVLYGLYDARNYHYLENEKKDFVISSARSITEHSNIQNFMIEKFGFRKAYCKIDLYYVFWLKVCIYILYPFRRLIKYPPLFNLLKFEEINRYNID